jgi:hypothetical protein
MEGSRVKRLLLLNGITQWKIELPKDKPLTESEHD